MKMNKKTIVIGFVGSTLDQGKRPDRWQRWRPTLSLLMHEDLIVDELVLLHDRQHRNLVDFIREDGRKFLLKRQFQVIKLVFVTLGILLRCMVRCMTL